MSTRPSPGDKAALVLRHQYEVDHIPTFWFISRDQILAIVTEIRLKFYSGGLPFLPHLVPSFPSHIGPLLKCNYN